MKIGYDRDVDALYIRLREDYVFRTVELEEGINLDFDESGRLLGIEILDAKSKYHPEEIFNFATEQLILSED